MYNLALRSSGWAKIRLLRPGQESFLCSESWTSSCYPLWCVYTERLGFPKLSLLLSVSMHLLLTPMLLCVTAAWPTSCQPTSVLSVTPFTALLTPVVSLTMDMPYVFQLQMADLSLGAWALCCANTSSYSTNTCCVIHQKQ